MHSFTSGEESNLQFDVPRMIRSLRVFLVLLLLSGEESRTTLSPLPTTGCDGRAHVLFAPHCPDFISQLPLLRGAALAAVTIGFLLLTEWTRAGTHLEQPLFHVFCERLLKHVR